MSEGAIKRKVTVNFLDGTQISYTNEDNKWSICENSIAILNKYTEELLFVYPYNFIKYIQQETIR